MRHSTFILLKRRFKSISKRIKRINVIVFFPVEDITYLEPLKTLKHIWIFTSHQKFISCFLKKITVFHYSLFKPIAKTIQPLLNDKYKENMKIINALFFAVIIILKQLHISLYLKSMHKTLQVDRWKDVWFLTVAYKN